MSKTLSKAAKDGTSSSVPSSNWLTLQKKLTGTSKKSPNGDSRKRRKKVHVAQKESGSGSSSGSTTLEKEASDAIAGPSKISSQSDVKDMKNGESLSALKRMVLGANDPEFSKTEEIKQPGKYIAIDCEMVGVGIDGIESSLARVTLVNFYGVVMLDEFVRQRERVVDYRTQWSGIRERDMVRAKPFDEIQRRAAELIKDRILVGHAVHNDLKALLLSHPWPLTRDTQYFAGKYKVVRSKYVALRNLVHQELGLTIQGGEHSSLIDARATMAVYRLHRKEWEKGNVGALTTALLIKTKPKPKPATDEDDVNGDTKRKGKRKRPVSPDAGENLDALDDSENEEEEDYKETTGANPFEDVKSRLKSKSKLKVKPKQTTSPVGGRKGISSGLSIVVTTRKGKREGKNSVGSGHGSASRSKSSSVSGQWWKELGRSTT